MVVVAVVLGMLAFGKTGYAKGIQDAILGSANHIVETGENIVPKPAKASDIIEIEGTKYVVLKECEGYQALVMTASSIGYKKFQSSYDRDSYLRPDGQNANTYEGSEIDNYLENEWYNNLSSTMKAAIQPTKIKQDSYYSESPDSKQETEYNTISRHAFLPSIEEIRMIVDTNNPEKVKAFLKNSEIWTRDSFRDESDTHVHPYIHFVWDLQGWSVGEFSLPSVSNLNDTRPAFVIDLSGVKYTIAGHTDYK